MSNNLKVASVSLVVASNLRVLAGEEETCFVEFSISGDLGESILQEVPWTHGVKPTTLIPKALKALKERGLLEKAGPVLRIFNKSGTLFDTTTHKYF